jgi:hypothetical protein
MQRFTLNGHGSRNGQALLFKEDSSDEEETAPTALEEKQALLGHHVRLCARRITNGLFVAGPGGLGKSRTISVTLADEGVCPVLVNSHITPLSLYLTLFHNRVDACIWLDDCDAIYQNLQTLGLLRSALWGQEEGRIVTYTSSQLPNVPNRFVFEGQVIFCANNFPKRNEAFKAVLSRVDVFELTATNDEVLELMRTMALNGFNKLSPKRCLEVVQFIAKAGGTRQLSMRLYEPSMKKVEYAIKNGVPWRELVRSQLDQIGISEGVPEPLDSKGHDLSTMAQAIATHPQSVKAQEEFWCKATGKSRASFFRTKKQYETEKKNSE